MSEGKMFDLNTIITAGIEQQVKERTAVAIGRVEPGKLDEHMDRIIEKELLRLEEDAGYAVRDIVKDELRKRVVERMDAHMPALLERVLVKFLETTIRWGDFNWRHEAQQALRSHMVEVMKTETERIKTIALEHLRTAFIKES